MAIRFRCRHCNKRISKHSLTLGSHQNCDACGKEVVVPLPNRDRVFKVLQTLPIPLPRRSFEEYESTFIEMDRQIKTGIAICDLCGFDDLVVGFVDAAIRQLRNLRVFVINCDKPPVDTTPSGASLPSLAAGNDFAGVGQTTEKLISYRKWEKSYPARATPDVANSLSDLIQASIDEYSAVSPS